MEAIERKIAHAAGDFNFMERLLCFLGARGWGSGFGEDDGVVDPLFWLVGVGLLNKPQ